jgi:hypothetical protein
MRGRSPLFKKMLGGMLAKDIAFGLEVFRHVETVVETSAACTYNGHLDLQMKNIEGLTAADQTVEMFRSSSLPAPAAHSVLPLLDAQ